MQNFSHISGFEYYVFLDLTKNSKSDVDERGHRLRFFHKRRRSAHEEFVGDYSVPGIITQYQGLLITQYQGLKYISIAFMMQLQFVLARNIQVDCKRGS